MSESARCSCGVALEGPLGHAYNEEAFRHLLAVERRRAAQSQHSVLLLLVTVRKPGGSRQEIPAATAAQIFTGLCHSVREVDFIGWLREDRVAGAVLTQGPDTPTGDAGALIGRRITDTLIEHLPLAVARRLHVRVLQLRSQERLT